MRDKPVVSGVAILTALACTAFAESREIVAVHKHPSEQQRGSILERAVRDGDAVDVSDDAETFVVWRSSGEPRSSIATLSNCASLSTTPVWSSADDFAVGGLRWLDVNDDGYLDLVSAHYQGGFPARPQETRVWLNLGGTLETTASWLSTDAVWSTDVVVGDIDQDGFPDLAIVNSSTSKIHFHDGTGIETTPSWASASTFWSLAGCLGRINGSPFPDLVLVNQTNQSNVLHGNFTGIPSPVITWASIDLGENTACALGDYDEDGVTVVVIPLSGDGSRKAFRVPRVPIHRVVQVTVDGVPVSDVSIHLRDCWAVFRAAPPAGSGNIELTLEVSNDLDLAVSVRQGNAKVYPDTGTTLGGNPLYTVNGPGTQREKGIAWVDIDGDGDLDLFVGGDDLPMQLFRNNSGTLDANSFWASADASPDVADIDWVDMDGDGDLDLATANSTTSPVVRVYENIGGVLDTVECWGIPWGGSMAQAVAWGDIDSDGSPDLAVAYAGAPIEVYRGLPQPRLEKTADNVNPVQNDNVRFTILVTDEGGLGLSGCSMTDNVNGTGCMTLADSTGCISSTPVDGTFACAGGVASSGLFSVAPGGTREYVIEVTATGSGNCANTVELSCNEGSSTTIETIAIQAAPNCNLIAADIDTGPPLSPMPSSLYVSACNGLGGPDAYTAIANPADPDELTPPAFTDLVLYQLGCGCTGTGIHLYESVVIPGNVGLDIF